MCDAGPTDLIWLDFDFEWQAAADALVTADEHQFRPEFGLKRPRSGQFPVSNQGPLRQDQPG